LYRTFCQKKEISGPQKPTLPLLDKICYTDVGKISKKIQKYFLFLLPSPQSHPYILVPGGKPAEKSKKVKQI
jgi:hypothetical protein